MAAKSGFFYGWVIVAVSAILLTMYAGTMYSFGVFFKPLVAEFGWTRAATSGVYSTFTICHGAFAILMGWLADRFGPARVMALCGFVMGLGLVLSSQVNALWQFYVSYGLIVGLAAGGPFVISTSTTARWFTRRRGLALGVVASGFGIGTMIVVPTIERLIAAFGWSRAYLVLGVAVWVVIIGSALLLRRDAEDAGQPASGMREPLPHTAASTNGAVSQMPVKTGITVGRVARSKQLWIMISAYLLFSFCLQTVMAHLVNHATDLGISALVAATFISLIGAGSITGRLGMGTASDRIGGNNALIVCCVVLVTTLLWLIFAREVWMFYAFAIVFGFAYGGEVPQMPVLVGRLFGLSGVGVVMGMVILGTTVGGAIGSWAAGQIFDSTNSYRVAFIIAAVASVLAVVAALALKKQRSLVP